MSKNSIFKFDRYVNGVKMAEGITITKAPSLIVALEMAKEMIKNYDDYYQTRLKLAEELK